MGDHDGLQLRRGGRQMAALVHNRVQLRWQCVALQHAMHERSWTGVKRRTLLAQHSFVLTTNGAASASEQLLRLEQPRVWIASVPRVAAPLQLEPLHAMLILPVPRRASGEAVTQHVARLLCGLDNAAREAQQTGEGSTLVLKLKHVVAPVWGSASNGEGGKCGGARERGEARGEQAERGCVVAGCELF